MVGGNLPPDSLLLKKRLFCPVLNNFAHAGNDYPVRKIRANTGASISHDTPVVDVGNYGLDERPGFTHMGFDRVDGTFFIPEYAISILFLS
jgi:hypothetical protein